MSKTVDLLGQQAEYYLNHTCKTIDKKLIHVPGPDVIDKIWVDSDRNVRTRTWTPCEYRVCIHSAGRPGYRTYSRSIIRS